MEKAVAFFQDRSDGREDAATRCQQALAYLASKPGCGVCGGREAHLARQRRDGKNLVWSAMCSSCSAKADAKRRAPAPAPAGKAATTARPVAPVRAAVPAPTPAPSARQTIYAKIAPFYRPADTPAKGAALGAIRECLVPGCFARAIATGKIDVDIDHLRDWPVASQQSGTLRLWEDAIALWAEMLVEPGLAARVARGDFHGCSFEFRASEFDHVGLWGIRPLKYVRLVDLLGVSLVSKRAVPTYGETGVFTKAQYEAERAQAR